jgi:hypothetical protein
MRIAGTRPRTGVALSCALWALWFASRPSGAKADGAFADSQIVLVSRVHPHRIIASSDVSGLVVSDDDRGQPNRWLCDRGLQ